MLIFLTTTIRKLFIPKVLWELEQTTVQALFTSCCALNCKVETDCREKEVRIRADLQSVHDTEEGKEITFGFFYGVIWNSLCFDAMSVTLHNTCQCSSCVSSNLSSETCLQTVNVTL